MHLEYTLCPKIPTFMGESGELIEVAGGSHREVIEKRIEEPGRSNKKYFMEEGKFNAGDVVKLKSGGPDMTIKHYYDDNAVRCIWFLDGLVKEDFFAAAALKKVEDHDESVFQ